MLGVDTFLTTLYVMVDNFCHSYPSKTNPGPQASLSESEVAQESTMSDIIMAAHTSVTDERKHREALHELQRLQAARAAAGCVPPPLAVDVDLSGLPESDR